MNKITLVLFVVAYAALGQSDRNLLGVVTRDSLQKEPFKAWFDKGVDAYKPEPTVVANLKKVALKDYTIEVFFGTWCGDSRRDLPRLFKIADAIGLPLSNIKLIAVATGEQYKQGPKGETVGRGIYRVATFVVMKAGKEVNRITEHSVISLEADLLEIMTTNKYEGNYKGYPLINQWLNSGMLASENYYYRGLARQLAPLVVTPGELNATGHVLIAQKRFMEAATVFRINSFLFYDSPDAIAGLAEALSKDGKHQEAMDNIQYAFYLDKQQQSLRSLLDTYYEIRAASEKGK